MPELLPKLRRALACLALSLVLVGCETVPLTPAADFVGDTVIVTDYAQFFRLGPQQAGGADLSLRTGERVMLQRKEFGYSRVQLEDGQIGYIANEDLQAAPPEPRRKFGLRENQGRSEGSSRGRQRASSGEENFEYEDIPLPDPNLDPNLDIAPEEIPLEPLPEVPLPSPDGPPNQPKREPVKIPVPGAEPATAPAPVGPPTTPQEATPPPVSTST